MVPGEKGFESGDAPSVAELVDGAKLKDGFKFTIISTPLHLDRNKSSNSP